MTEYARRANRLSTSHDQWPDTPSLTDVVKKCIKRIGYGTMGVQPVINNPMNYFCHNIVSQLICRILVRVC